MKGIQGNLVKLFKIGQFDFIMHGCNCFSSMEAGIAKQIVSEFPQILEEDKKYQANKQRIYKLGMFSEISFYGYGTIINAYTQYYPGSNFEYSALKSCLYLLKTKCKNKQYRKNHNLKKKQKPKLGVPLIGCGIGGGDFTVVRELLSEFNSDFDITIVHYDNGTKKMDQTEINFQF